jgi:hypothetical protein
MDAYASEEPANAAGEAEAAVIEANKKNDKRQRSDCII